MNFVLMLIQLLTPYQRNLQNNMGRKKPNVPRAGFTSGGKVKNGGKTK